MGYIHLAPERCSHCARLLPVPAAPLAVYKRANNSAPRKRPQRPHQVRWRARASVEKDSLASAAPSDGATLSHERPAATVGEDAAAFDPGQQSAGKWAFFTAELVAVLGIMYAVRLYVLLLLLLCCHACPSQS